MSREFNRLIRSVPNGSTIVFKAGGTYQLGGRIRMLGRKRITLEGNGASLRLTGSHRGGAVAIDAGSEDITVRNLSIVGNHSAAGTDQACCGRESEHGIAVYGSFDTLIENVDIRRVGGDCFYVEPSPADNPPDGVTVRDSSCRLTGRHGVGLEGGKNIVVENTHFDQLGFDVIDIEPGNPVYGIRNFVFKNNTIGSYGLTGNYNSWFLAACDAPWNTQGSVIRNVTVTGNTVEGNRQGWSGKMLGLQTLVCDDGPRADFTFTNNTAKSSVDEGRAGVLIFRGVTGVTVTGNKQPLSGGVFATFPGSTNVTYDG